MSDAIELELGYLARAIPQNLANCQHIIIEDIYFPAQASHMHLRIRHKGDTYELTKKTQLDAEDAGNQREENILLTAEEYHALARGDGRKLMKTRYYLPYQDITAEVDVFGGPLEGLIIIEFEFASHEQKGQFKQPSFCLADVTQEAAFAGGVLPGKSYEDIEPDLQRFKYKKLLLHK